MEGSSRRDALKGAFVLAAGAIGLGPAARAATRLAPADEQAASPVFELQATGIRAEGLAFAQAPRLGDRYTLRGELASPEGGLAGTFAATVVAAGRQGAVASAVESHWFVLADGAIFGMGTRTPGTSDAFAVVGGTGRFAGASGTYTVVAAPLGLGGDGTGRFIFRLTQGVR
jgi:hypothetical protein